MVDVVIIGSGPAGSIAAKKICDEGHSVTLYEKERIPRHKHCAGYVSPKSVKMLDIADIDCSEVINQSITGFKIKCMHEYFDLRPEKSDIISGNVYREEFDTYLTDCARQSGAKVVDSSRVTSIEKNDDGKYSVVTPDGSEKCDIVIGADGVYSFTRRHLGIEYDKKKIGVSLETEISVDQEVFDYYDNMNFYDMGSFNCGYSWVFPKIKGGTVNVGVCVWAVEAKKMKITIVDLLHSFLDSLDWYKDQEINPQGHLIPFMGTVKKLGEGNIILIGDAAGFVGVGGEGIPSALESGLHAAESVKQYYNGGGQLLELYEDLSKDLVTDLNWFLPRINKIMLSPRWLKPILRMADRDEEFRKDLMDFMTHSMSMKDAYNTFSVRKIVRAFLSLLSRPKSQAY